jgi:hypothetical protein
MRESFRLEPTGSFESSGGSGRSSTRIATTPAIDDEPLHSRRGSKPVEGDFDHDDRGGISEFPDSKFPINGPGPSRAVSAAAVSIHTNSRPAPSLARFPSRNGTRLVCESPDPVTVGCDWNSGDDTRQLD